MERAQVIRIDLERRSEPRTIVDQYWSVEISISSSRPAYLFRIRDISPPGIGILVKEESSVLKSIKVNEVLELKYNPAEKSELPRYMQTRVVHITKILEGRYGGNFLVGLSVLEKVEVPYS